MKSYHVTWEIEIDADDPQKAAEQAFSCMQRPETTATVFDVTDSETGETVRVDLLEEPDEN